MRGTALALILLVAGLAGCLSSDEGGGNGNGSRAIPDDAAPWSTLLCRDGYRSAERITEAVDVCNHRVTKPLTDPAVFDWQNQHGPANEVSIAVNPTNPLTVAGGGKDYTVSYISDVADCGEFTVWMGTYWSTDGGMTWGNDLMPGFQGDPRPSPLSGNLCNTDPVVVFDDDGTLWFHALNYVGARTDSALPLNPLGQSDLLTGSQLYFARSTNGGATYPDITFAAVGDDDMIFNDKNWMAVQPNGDHMMATWSAFVGTPGILPAGFGGPVILYTESFDAGATWGPMTTMPAGPAASALNVQFSMPQYLPADGTTDIAVIWADFGGPQSGGTAGVAYTEGVITPGGTVFSPPTQVCPMNPLKSGSGRDGTGPSMFRLSTYPVLAVDTSGGPFDGRRYVVWSDQPGALDSDVDVKMCWSDDGATWTDPVTITNVTDGDQIMPWIDVDPNGGIHAVWYDRRHNPTTGFLDVYYTYSGDGGQTWGPDIRVSETSFDGDLGLHQTGVPFIGDYIGLDTTTVSAHVLWADTRHTGEQGRLTGSDVYAATILKGRESQAVFDAVYE